MRYKSAWLLWGLASGGPPAAAQDDFERAPIAYSQSVAENAVTRLEAAVEAGAARLEHSDDGGYLRSLLAALDVPVASQVLVFSQTSLQRDRISPRFPRAVYFNDEVYVGYCQGGEVLEISTVDPHLGTAFYTLDQQESTTPRFTRQTDNCLTCHSSSRTGSVPGHLVRSLYVDPTGQPLLSAGSYAADHTTPFAHRWGGWYVTGVHGAQRHLGNRIVPRGEDPRQADASSSQNVTDLAPYCAIDRYLSPHSDLAALMVLEHQTLVHNRLTQANFVARQALHYEAELNRALGNPSDQRLDSTTRRIQNAGDHLVEALLLSGEARLTEPVRGTAGFAEEFARHGPRDPGGRSLRTLDLERRLFRYPCSYLIYSSAFAALPDPMRAYVAERLWRVLAQGEGGPAFAHLSAADRRALVEILQATARGLPAPWPPATGG